MKLGVRIVDAIFLDFLLEDVIMPTTNPLLVKLDTFFGYGKQDRSWKWWFDFEASQEEIHRAQKSENNIVWME